MNYLKSIILIIIISLFGSIFRHTIASVNLVMLYILGVVIVALRWGRGPSLFTAILSVLVFDFFFVPPHLSMTVADTQYLIAFATLFIVATVISSLALKAKEQAHSAQNREMQAIALYKLSKDLGTIMNMESLLRTIEPHIQNVFHAYSAIYLNKNDDFSIIVQSPGFIIEERVDIAARQCFANGESAGVTSSELYEAPYCYVPLKTTRAVFGVLVVCFRDNNTSSHEQIRLLHTFANQISFAIERQYLLDEAQQTALLRRAEKLHTAFLESVSHDLRTPLATISGTLSSLLQNTRIDKKNKLSLIETAYQESVRLNQLVGELLDMARIEAGALYLNRKPGDIRDLIGSALKQMEKVLHHFKITVKVPDYLPEIDMDYILMLKVLTNILDNAVKYSQSRKKIDIKAGLKKGHMVIQTSDCGIGIPVSDLKHIFDKFYRVKRPQTCKGTGLGLSVCKGIIEAHHGQIWAETRPQGGTVITVSIPIKEKYDQ